VVVLVRGLIRPREYKAADITPSVTMVLAAHNEAPSIGPKLENVLSLDYPSERMNVVVASDGSNDGTDEIVRQYEGPRVRLLSLNRCGKAAALNAAAAAAGGEILVFSDANSMYARTLCASSCARSPILSSAAWQVTSATWLMEERTRLPPVSRSTGTSIAC